MYIIHTALKICISQPFNLKDASKYVRAPVIAKPIITKICVPVIVKTISTYRYQQYMLHTNLPAKPKEK